MNIYLITQNINNGYDTYDSSVVAAASLRLAKEIHPSDTFDNGEMWWKDHGYPTAWAKHPDEVEAELIGTTDRQEGVVLASFNAG